METEAVFTAACLVRHTRGAVERQRAEISALLAEIVRSGFTSAVLIASGVPRTDADAEIQFGWLREGLNSGCGAR